MKRYWIFRESELYLLDQMIDIYMVSIKDDLEYRKWMLGYIKHNFANGNVKISLSYDDSPDERYSRKNNINSIFLDNWTLIIINKSNDDESLGTCMGTVTGLMRYNKLSKIYESG